MKTSATNIKNALLLLIRIWLGYRLIDASYSSVMGILFRPQERIFFENWFGKELHFPAPVFMAFLAKGAEMCGGILVLIGAFTKPAAVIIAFTMLVATLVANLGKDWVIDGGFTVSYFLFALILIVDGAGKFSMDQWFFARAKTIRLKN